jgi:hypothetical protein
LAISNKELVTNCQELVNIYDKKGSKRLLAGVSTSVSEAMRAGICKGVLEEHASHSYCHGHWYDQALYIIENGEREDDLSVEQLLDNACAG